MRCLIIFLLMILVSGPAFAGASPMEQAVKDYLQGIGTLYTAEKVDQSKIVSFIKKHIADDAAISVQTEISGVKGMQESNFTKDDIISVNSSKDMETLDSSAFSEMTGLEDMGDGKSKVSYMLWVNATIRNMQDSKKVFYVDYRAESACEEVVTLNNETLTVLKSACHMKASYGMPYGNKK